MAGGDAADQAADTATGSKRPDETSSAESRPWWVMGVGIGAAGLLVLWVLWQIFGPEFKDMSGDEVSLLVQELVNGAMGGAYLCGSGWAPGQSCEGLTVGIDRLKPMDGDLSTSIENQEKARAGAEQQREQLEARLAQERTQLEAEREQQRLRNEKSDLELEAVRRQVEVLGVDGYIAKIKNEALRDAVDSGNVQLYVVPEGSDVQLSGG